MAITMTLGGVSLGESFPVFGRTFEYIRPDPQGPAIKRVKMTISGFLEGNSSAGIRALYTTLINSFALNDLVAFTYIHDATTICSNIDCYVGGFNEPEDLEFAKAGVGDYAIELYYFEDQIDNLGILCTYGAYTFDKTPKWGRVVTPIREHPRAPKRGSFATIGLSGMLVAPNHNDLMGEIVALQTAFQSDGLLTYGTFVQAVRVVDCRVEDVVVRNYAFYQISLAYDIGSIILLNRRIEISRVHQNPVITEEPFCDRRLIELMNPSGQTISYNFNIESSISVADARATLAVELANTLEPGGVEMPGGREVWNLDTFNVAFSCTKFYNTPPIPNLV